MIADSNETMIPCPCCEGGRWETECCSGAGGCSCRGQRVDMGMCNVCNGYGQIEADTPPEMLRGNINAIMGNHFIGSGPRDGSWADAKCMGIGESA